MRNFQKNFDRLLDRLKECDSILRDCSKEMAQALSLEKGTHKRYAIYSKRYSAYITEKYSDVMGRLQDAYLFKTKEDAEVVMEVYDPRDELTIKVIRYKEQEEV